MLKIMWPATNFEMVDHIPMRWFRNVGTSDSRTHYIIGHEGRISVRAHCGLSVMSNEAFLDYGGVNETKNTSFHIDIGTSQIIFTDDTRIDIEQVLWRAKSGEHFLDVGTSFSLGEDDIAMIEGGPKLVQHLSVERQPKLARLKKDAMRKQMGYLECEACEIDLRSTYDEHALACYEVHHEVGLAGSGERLVNLTDLAVLCANCHRAIHRTKPMMTVQAFRGTLGKIRAEEISKGSPA